MTSDPFIFLVDGLRIALFLSSVPFDLTLVVEPVRSTLPVPLPAIGHNSQLIPYTSHPHNLVCYSNLNVVLLYSVYKSTVNTAYWGIVIIKVISS